MAKRVKPGDPTRAVFYARVSTDDQHLGPEAQHAAAKAWTTSHGVAVVAEFEDHGISGTTGLEARPGLSAALAALREHGAGVLLVAKRDRIGRDILVATMIERAVSAAGAVIVSADGTGNGETAADQFLRTVVMGAAAYELALIRARTRAALEVKRARGERAGTIPYGYRLAADGLHIEPDQDEQANIAAMIELRLRGCSLRSIVRELAARGVACRSGKSFTLTQVQRLVARVAAPQTKAVA